MNEIKQFSSEEELQQYIDNFYEEEELKYETYQILNDDKDNETAGKCTQGCPPNYEYKRKVLFAVCISDEKVIIENYKQILFKAFTEANNYRLKRAIQRKNLQRFNKDLPSFPFVHEKPLTKDEILKFIDPTVKKTDLFHTMLDNMVNRLENFINNDNQLNSWEETTDFLINTGIDSVNLTIALVEGTIKGGINLLAEGLQGAYSLTKGVIIGTINLDKDKGVDAAIQTFKELREQNPDIPVSESSLKVLENNSVLKFVNDNFNSLTEEAGVAATEMWGEDTGLLVTDGVVALTKVVTIGTMRVPLNRTVNNTTKGLNYVKKTLSKDPNELVRVTQFYDPAKGTFPIDGKYALHAEPTKGMSRIIDGSVGTQTWVAPFSAEKMNFIRRIFTGVGDRRNYVEFTVRRSELHNPKGFKNIMGYFQKTIDGKVDLTQLNRNVKIGIAAPNPISKRKLIIGNVVIIGVAGYKLYENLSE